MSGRVTIGSVEKSADDGLVFVETFGINRDETRLAQLWMVVRGFDALLELLSTGVRRKRRRVGAPRVDVVKLVFHQLGDVYRLREDDVLSFFADVDVEDVVEPALVLSSPTWVEVLVELPVERTGIVVVVDGDCIVAVNPNPNPYPIYIYIYTSRTNICIR